MKKSLFILLAFFLLSGHDMFLKLDTYFLNPNTDAAIKLYNGTFEKSENAIDRSRMIDVSLVGNGVRSQVDTTQWSDKDHTSFLSFTTGDAGTWVAGVSTYARNIELSASDFNEYLDHDGVLDMLNWRKENNAMDRDAVEKYSKHVKAIFQVGESLTDDWATSLGYPIEFIPLDNPYSIKAGDDMQVKLLRQGEPLANQLVYVGSSLGESGHDHEEAHHHEGEHEEESGTNDATHEDHHHAAAQVRTDDQGIVNIKLTSEGIWYLRTIHMIHSEEPGLTHESNWATLTFEIGHGHSHSGHSHDHGSDHSHGMNKYLYWVVGVVLILGLIFWVTKRA
jgi:uncharacterized GH25 family protein